VSARPGTSAPSTFHKQSIPPALVTPTDGTVFAGPARFHWQPAEAARRYRLQVSQDPTFATNIVEDIVTDSTAYTSSEHYAADVNLYWRVRADDENLIGLTWSAVRTFQRRLAAPVPDPNNVTISDFTPAWAWSNITGASGYTFQIDGPDGSHKDYAGLRVPAATFIYLYGPGIWRWRVRAEYPKLPTGTVTGPWSSYVPFTRTLSEPSGVQTSVSGHHVLLQWNWKLGVKDFRVQISQRPDFATTLEDVTTDNTSYAPVMTHPFYANGGTFYWRVVGRDKGFNLGDWSQARQIDIAQRLRVAVNRPVMRKRWNRITVTVSDPANKPVARALVRVSGAGAKARRARTNSKGKVSFRVRPRKKGRLLFSATKAGYAAGALSMRVR
jgi:hypothetical protein